jgi:hypothetical protein
MPDAPEHPDDERLPPEVINVIKRPGSDLTLEHRTAEERERRTKMGNHTSLGAPLPVTPSGPAPEARTSVMCPAGNGEGVNRFLLSRRALLRATTAFAAAVGLNAAGTAAARRRRFWFLDRRHTGLHDFYHFVGYVSAPIALPPSPVPDFLGAVSIAPPLDSGGGLYVNMAWEVEQVLSSGRHLFRARLTNAQLDDAKTMLSERLLDDDVAGAWTRPAAAEPLLSELMPYDAAAGAWMSPADAERNHGIVIQRR